jgi:hypothetical protein
MENTATDNTLRLAALNADTCYLNLTFASQPTMTQFLILWGYD